MLDGCGSGSLRLQQQETPYRRQLRLPKAECRSYDQPLGEITSSSTGYLAAFDFLRPVRVPIHLR